MKFPVFTSIILLVIILQINLRRVNRNDAKEKAAYLKREREAFKAPRRDISQLNYIIMPDTLPLNVLIDDPKIKELHKRLKNLSEKKIINLYGMSNTDIRLTYGALNFEALSMADTRYLILIRSLSELGELYYEHGHIEEARAILEYAISIDSDVKNTYVILNKIYKDCGESEKADDLMEKAKRIKTMSKDGVIAALEEMSLDEIFAE